ncbi:hypothetical protein F4780DRAFT_748506 [Xylariomycetidae sp. FL0641]|nr:hypothetical protein F4780DRAFT_748506 [Xylariomycetidae sp. FL0641]
MPACRWSPHLTQLLQAVLSTWGLGHCQLGCCSYYPTDLFDPFRGQSPTYQPCSGSLQPKRRTGREFQFPSNSDVAAH